MVSPTQNHEAFRTTHWSLVLEAGDLQKPGSNQAFEQLYLLYWKPLYSFLRLQGHQPQDSEDLVQGLFQHLVQRREFFQKADRNRGRFRSFLLGALRNFLSDVKAKESAMKRGGGSQLLPLDVPTMEQSVDETKNVDPGEEFDRSWAMIVLEEAIAGLKAKLATRGRSEEYEVVFSYISGKSGATSPGELARQLGVSEPAFKMKATRMRQAFGRALREVVGKTVASSADLPEELAYLKGLMKKSL